MGTDGSASVYPFWGSFKRYTQNFPSVALSQGPIALWALALGAWPLVCLGSQRSRATAFLAGGCCLA